MRLIARPLLIQSMTIVHCSNTAIQSVRRQTDRALLECNQTATATTWPANEALWPMTWHRRACRRHLSLQLQQRSPHLVHFASQHVVLHPLITQLTTQLTTRLVWERCQSDVLHYTSGRRTTLRIKRWHRLYIQTHKHTMIGNTQQWHMLDCIYQTTTISIQC